MMPRKPEAPVGNTPAEPLLVYLEDAFRLYLVSRSLKKSASHHILIVMLGKKASIESPLQKVAKNRIAAAVNNNKDRGGKICQKWSEFGSKNPLDDVFTLRI